MLLVCGVAAIAARAQTFTVLVNFDCANGADSTSSLAQGNDGNLYGTTQLGGANGGGTVFKITRAGVLTTLYSFCSQTGCADGDEPVAGLVQGADGNLYGTTAFGGAGESCLGGCGTVYKITPAGTLATLHSFEGTDGSAPQGALIQASDGNFYGTTSLGGSDTSCFGGMGCGTVYRITPGGTLTVLLNFDSTDGANPVGGLVQASDGNLYGTTTGGSLQGYGTVFKVSPLGAFTSLHSFDRTDGATPAGTLVQGTDGSLYGTTEGGGADDDGTVFKITTDGTLTMLHSFDGTDGALPFGALVQTNDGNFYGTTSEGGSNSSCFNCGTIFRVNRGGTLLTVRSFATTDGYEPIGGVAQSTNGGLYGTTQFGGSGLEGTVFTLRVGLGPFVETVPTSGKVGAGVRILGTSLSGATSVTFNGAAASFSVVSDSLIKATVPAGATTGPVQVVTPSGTLSSNVQFQVK